MPKCQRQATHDGMDLSLLLRAVLALVFTLGLIGLVAYVVRRFAGSTFPNLLSGQTGKNARLSVVESKLLDPRHTLFLIKRDGVEHLVLCSAEGAVVVIESAISAPPSEENQPKIAVPLGAASDLSGRIPL